MKPKMTKPIDKKHKHIWKYIGPYERVCEAPFPTIKSCGKHEIYHTQVCCPEGTDGWGS